MIDFGDVLIFVGWVMVEVGLWLLDPRWALVAGGVALLLLGVARLRRRRQGAGQE